MADDLTESLDRDSRAMERIANAFERFAKVFEDRFNKDFPPAKVKREAELIRSDERAEQFSDKPSDDWLKETEAATGPSRFAARAAEAGVKATPPPRGRAVEIPKGNGNKAKPS
jgi:hypothetical protein